MSSLSCADFAEAIMREFPYAVVSTVPYNGRTWAANVDMLDALRQEGIYCQLLRKKPAWSAVPLLGGMQQSSHVWLHL
jgi:hypothetical protein